MVEVKPEDHLHLVGLVGVDGQATTARIDVVAEHRAPSSPLALAPSRRNLIARAFGDDLPLELGEGEQDIEREPTEGIGSVELLRYRNEADLVFVEDLDNRGEVDQLPSQPVHLVD